MSYILNTSTDLLCRAAEAENLATTSGVCLLGSREGFTGHVQYSRRPFLPMAEARGFSGGLR